MAAIVVGTREGIELVDENDVLDLLHSILNRPRWHARAACRGSGVAAFFSKSDPDLGITVCGDCPVRAECLAFAVEHDCDGVWGATTAQERRNGKWAAEVAEGRRRARERPCTTCGAATVTRKGGTLCRGCYQRAWRQQKAEDDAARASLSPAHRAVVAVLDSIVDDLAI